MLPPLASSARSWRRTLILLFFFSYVNEDFLSSHQALAFISPRSPVRSRCQYSSNQKSFPCNSEMATSLVEEADVSASNKRQKTMHENSIQDDSDPLLTFIPETVLTTTLSASNNEKAPSSLKSLRLPSKLAYPFWYDPHPIAKWAADRLKAELPPYTIVKTETASGETDTPSITLGKMYGVLVVSQPSGKIGYLKAFSGTMPRPQYGGSANQEIDTSFVPSVFDRFAKASKEDSGDDFDYERDEEVLNSLTREIQRLESCPERKRQREGWKESKGKLEKEISDAKKLQKSNKRNRKARRNKLRERLLKEETDLPGFEKEKDAHAYFLEHNEEYRNLEDQLVQESALDQREFKALKAKIETEIETIEKSLEEQSSQIEKLKQKRKDGSNELQQKLFDQYKLLNVHGETKTPVEIFKNTPLRVPPSGTGDCAAIKLFQHAFSKGYRPIALAEFWWGPSPHASEGDVARTHGNYYPCCRGKCEPILSRHILLGTDVESDPLTEGLNLDPQNEQTERELSIVYEDEWLVVVDKPHDVLSVPGRKVEDSIKTDLQKRYPDATGPILVHRLDYSTSGLLLAAKDSNTHKLLQAQFINRTVKKRYTALLDGNLLEQKSIETRGSIDLPLAGDYLNRPMQKVERGPEGKPALTVYEIVQESEEQTEGSRTRIHFYPQTGRTHQLRVHASHPEGLGMAIVGDDIYGQRDERLCLHAGLLEIDHPYTKKRITFKAPVPF